MKVYVNLLNRCHPLIQTGTRVLHESNYSVKESASKLTLLISNDSDLQPWTAEMKGAFNKAIVESNMYMRVVSSKVGKSVNSCLAYYYGTFKHTEDA